MIIKDINLKPLEIPTATLDQRLKLLPIDQWNSVARDVENQDEMLQEVLDVLSPMKTPACLNPREELQIEGFRIQSMLLGEGISPVRLATHLLTGRMVFQNN